MLATQVKKEILNLIFFVASRTWACLMVIFTTNIHSIDLFSDFRDVHHFNSNKR